jgi:hypothetical protein
VTRFIDHFNTRLVTTLNYSAIANLLTLKIATAHAKSFPACNVLTSRFLVTAPDSADYSASALTPLPAGHRLATELNQVKVKVTLRLTVSQSVNLGVEPHLGPMARYYK